MSAAHVVFGALGTELCSICRCLASDHWTGAHRQSSGIYCTCLVQYKQLQANSLDEYMSLPSAVVACPVCAGPMAAAAVHCSDCLADTGLQSLCHLARLGTLKDRARYAAACSARSTVRQLRLDLTAALHDVEMQIRRDG